MIPAVVQGEDTESGSSSPFGQDSHPMLQHLELTCLQDTMNMQHAIQQFHLSLASVIPIPHAEETPLVTSEPAVLSKVESINPFDALAPTASTTPKPASSSINSLMNLLKGGGAATPVVDAHPLKSPAADNFPYFALQKQESMEPPAAAAEPPAASDAFRSDTSSGFSAPVSSPPLPASTESRQQGLRIIDFLKSNAPAGVTEIIPPVDSALEVNPFDEASAVEIVPAALTGKKSGKDKKKSAIAETIAVAPTVAAPISLIDMESSVPHSMLGQIQSIVSSECRNAVEDVLRKDGWKDEMCVQISNDLKAELTMAIAEAVREGIKEQLKESVKTFLGKSFKTAFETTLVPAFQVGTAVLHTKLEGNYEQASRAISELNLHESNVILKLDHMQTELATLRASVSSLTAEVTSLREQQAKQGYTMAAAGKVDYETDPLVLLGQGRLADAVECALECHDISILLQVLKGSSTDAVLGCCNKLVVVCVIQQLAFDFSNNDPEEGVPARLDWLKELVMAVVSGDVERKMSVDGDAQLVGESKVQKACSTILQGVFDCLKKVELRIAPTGSIRTDLRMLCSLVKSVE